jgi:YD repeat-containing protein
MDPLLTHDAQDQLTGVTYKTGGAVERIVSYFYDAAGNRTNLTEILGKPPTPPCTLPTVNGRGS